MEKVGNLNSYKTIPTLSNKKDNKYNDICIINLNIETMSNENKTLRFKTNIKCGGCVAKITPVLNEAEGICHWEVDTTHKDKILTVLSDGITEQKIIQKVQEAGYKIELLNTQ